MTETLSGWDWLVIAIYLIGLLLFSAYLAKTQQDRKDYFVGGQSLPAFPIAISILATQCSTNSILGAPAFVAFAAGGGVVWLQYELAVPLAMLFIMVFLLPLFRQLQLVSVYEYLEQRFGLASRLVMSGLFQLIRAFATAVTVYSIALVIEIITGLSFTGAVILLGVATAIYDALGGIKAVIYSDLLQMAVLVAVLCLLLGLLIQDSGGWATLWSSVDPSRLAPLDFSHHGWGDGHNYSFWPMLIGGFFLYVSYYGCDQSQVQRQLCARDMDTGNRALLLNGLLRFPVVLLYCLVGVGIAAYAAQDPTFLDSLPRNTGADTPNINLAVPAYMLQTLPVGLVGLAMVALFAAAMSSLDSVINALSATTMEDFYRRLRPNTLSESHELMLSRVFTLLWSGITLGLAFVVGDIAPTVLEAINKIGSLINGPILGVFLLGLFTRITGNFCVLSGLLVGFFTNVILWVFIPNISWLWWNVIGFIVTMLTGLGLFYGWQSYLRRSAAPPSQHHIAQPLASLSWSIKRYDAFGLSRINWLYYGILIATFIALMSGMLSFN